jgi:hypothetical protein
VTIPTLRSHKDHVLRVHEGVDFDFLRGKTPVRLEDTAGPSPA